MRKRCARGDRDGHYRRTTPEPVSVWPILAATIPASASVACRTVARSLDTETSRPPAVCGSNASASVASSAPLSTDAAANSRLRRSPPVRTPDTPEPASGKAPSTWTPPARVAPGSPEASPGNGLIVTELGVPRRPKGSPYTVNDQLMAATALMVAHWNREHGARPRPLRITMPVDDRPRGTDMPIGNGTRLVEVTFAPEEVDASRMGELLRRTATRTRALKSADRPQLGHGAALLTAPVVPVAWRAAATRGGII